MPICRGRRNLKSESKKMYLCRLIIVEWKKYILLIL